MFYAPPAYSRMVGCDTSGVSKGKEHTVAAWNLLKLKLNILPAVTELENRLLVRFDFASQKWDLPTMAECAKILSQVSILMFT